MSTDLEITRDAPLGPLTTYKVGGPAAMLVEPSSEAEVIAAAGIARDAGAPVLVLGKGSNVVVADAGFPGMVIRLGPGLGERTFEDDGSITAGAGASLPVLARESAKAGRRGLEFLTGVPGTVGGAVRMNAGCHGSETCEWLIAARVLDLETAGISERSPDDLDMRYRHSNLRDSEIVLSARFRTEPGDPTEAQELIREITRWRRREQPGGTLNAGSVFKNPEGDAAGRVIDSLGLKGLRIGGAEVSHRHANFIVAHEGTTAADIAALIAEVRRRVRDETGIDLEPEVRLVGFG